jgi:hypothetical protein
MKGNVVKEYHYTGEYYGYTRISIGEDLYEYTYFYNRKVKMALSINMMGELVIHSPDKMQLDGKITNIVDRNGEEIYTNGEWSITQTAPLLGHLGVKEGYQYKAILVNGEI